LVEINQLTVKMFDHLITFLQEALLL